MSDEINIVDSRERERESSKTSIPKPLHGDGLTIVDSRKRERLDSLSQEPTKTSKPPSKKRKSISSQNSDSSMSL